MPTRSLIDAQILLGLKEAADELQFDVDGAMRLAGLSPQLLTRPTGYVSWFAINDLLEWIADEYGCQHLGLLTGKYQPPMQLGITAKITKLCPDVRTAILKGIYYNTLYSQIAQWELVEYGDNVAVTRTQRETGGGRYGQISTLGTVQVLKVLQSLCGPAWRPTSVSFSHAGINVAARREYSKYFKVPVSFNQESNSIYFLARDLERPIETADSELLKIVEHYAQTLMVEHNLDAGLEEQVRLSIRQQLGTSSCNINSIAHKLGFHPKTLHRQLKSAGLTFKQLLNEERCKLAQYYLANSDIQLTELADMLSYSSASALSRAFKRQCDLSPTQWKLDQGGRPAEPLL